MKSHSLKFLRVAVALLCVLALTFLFIDFTGIAAHYLAWLAKIQLVPALLAVNVLAIVLLAALTLLFGRLYCSVICPLGILQDVVIWLRRRFAPKTRRRVGLYRYAPAKRLWRVIFLGLFLLLLIAGLVSLIPMSFAGILDPYSAYGRIAGQGLVPIWRGAMSSLAVSAAGNDIYLFDQVPSALVNFNIAVAIVAAVTLIVTVVFAWRTGRGYCNTVCPVGTFLGILSRHSLLKPVIDTDKCNRCGSCGRKCKASCIDTKKHRIDYSRCVVCMDCINNCSQGAISYRLAPKGESSHTAAKINSSRRHFLTGVSIAAGSAVALAADKVTDGGLAPLKQKQRRGDVKTAVPAGAASLAHFRSHCTACQLCVSECPNEVLRPGTSLDGFMQPVMVFTSGFCRPECTRCGEVCPTGAIRPFTAADKASVRTGIAVVDAATCIAAAYGQTCGNCERHCPVEAVVMVKGENGNMRPVVNESLCIGCGSCEYHCPSGRAGMLSSNKAAIYVEGLEVHQRI